MGLQESLAAGNLWYIRNWSSKERRWKRCWRMRNCSADASMPSRYGFAELRHAFGIPSRCHLLKERGIEPIFQVTCRDRNRLALQADLLSASVLGLRHVWL